MELTSAIRAALSARDGAFDSEARSGGEVDAGVALSNVTVERALSSITVSTSADDDPVSRAFLTNDVRVALVTLRVLEEEASCSFDGPGDGANGGERVPRPSIPGT